MFIKVTEIRDGKCLSFQHYVNLDSIKIIDPAVDSSDTTSITFSDDSIIYVKETADEILKQINRRVEL